MQPLAVRACGARCWPSPPARAKRATPHSCSWVRDKHTLQEAHREQTRDRGAERRRKADRSDTRLFAAAALRACFLVRCVLLLAVGDKRCGKSALLSKFSDRVSSDILSSLSSTSSSALSGGVNSSSSSPSSLLASSAGAADYTVDFSYTPVKNRYGAGAGAGAGAGDKDEALLARMNIWQLDEPAHAGLIPTLLQTGQGTGGSSTSATSAAPAASSSSSSTAAAALSASSSQPLDYAALDSAVFVVSFDLSEPWRALESVQTWLAALSKVVAPALAALPEQQAKALRTKISKYTQSYYDAPSTNNDASIEAASPNDSPASPTNAATSPLSASSAATASPASIFLSSSSSSADASGSGGLPIDPAIPAFNLGVPIIVVGLKGDSFGRHVGTRGGAGATGGAAPASATAAGGGSSSSDEKFDFLTRKLRRLCMEWGATLVYTSVAHMSGGVRSQSSSSGLKDGGGVNVEVLQHYILHRLYKFPLNPAAADAAAAAAVAALDSSSLSSSSTAAAAATNSKVSSAAQAAAKSAQALAAKFSPRLIGSAEDDFGIYVPAGYDSNNLLDTTSKNAVSAAYGDDTPVEEVLKNPYATRGKTSAASAARGAQQQQQQFETVSAEDNTAFFKALKYQLEQGGGGAGGGLPLSLGAGGVSGSGSSSNALAAARTSTPKITPSPTHAHTTSIGGGAVVGPSSELTAEQKAAGMAAAAKAGGTAAAAGAPVPAVKGQIAVKQFFRSLLNNTSKPDANSKAAAQQVREVSSSTRAQHNAEEESPLCCWLRCSVSLLPLLLLCVPVCPESSPCECREGVAADDQRRRCTTAMRRSQTQAQIRFAVPARCVIVQPRCLFVSYL